MQEVLELDAFLRKNMQWEIELEKDYRKMIDDYLNENELKLVAIDTGLYTSWWVWLEFNHGVTILGIAERKNGDHIILIRNYRDSIAGISPVDVITLLSLTSSTIHNIQSNPK